MGRKESFESQCEYVMDPKKTTETTYYNSIDRHGVDEKRRVQVPAKWRPAKAIPSGKRVFGVLLSWHARSTPRLVRG